MPVLLKQMTEVHPRVSTGGRDLKNKRGSLLDNHTANGHLSGGQGASLVGADDRSAPRVSTKGRDLKKRRGLLLDNHTANGH